MTLSSDINTTSTSLKNIKDAINNKGGNASGDIINYPNYINELIKPVIPREITAQGIFQNLTSGTFNLPNNVTNLGSYSLCRAFTYASIMSANLSSLTTVSGNYALQYAFSNCTNLATVDLSSLTTISGQYSLESIFYNDTKLTTVDLSNLTTVSGSNALRYAFYGCTRLTSVNLSSLTTISGTEALRLAFQNCTGLTSIDLSSLTNIKSYGVLQNAFQGCTGLNNKSLSFPALTSTSLGSNNNQLNNMLKNVKGCTVHFPSNLQSVIGSWSDVTAGFGGTNTTVLFDLPATT